MSSALPTSNTGHSISLGALGCSASIGAQQPNGTPQNLSFPHASHERSSCESQLDERDAATVRPLVLSVRKHRTAEVREQQGVSQRTLARRLGIEVKALQALEQPESDLTISQLQSLQAALEVPLVDLLEESNALSRPIAERAKMVKVMKTAVALRETKSNRQVERMVQMLCEQLTDVMPELAEVSGWPQYGSRRGPSALGKALSQPIDTSDLKFPD